MKWIALSFLVVYFVALGLNKLVGAIWDYFQIDGGTTDGPRQLENLHTAERSIPISSTSDRVGGPSRVVDASNSPNVYPASEAERRDLLRLAGLVDIHHVSSRDPVLPPPSRSIRRVH